MRLTVGLLGCLLLGLSASAQSTVDAESALESRIRRIENSLRPAVEIIGAPLERFNLEERLKELQIPGLSIAVVSDGTIEWVKGYGMADVAEGREVDPETLFLAGSISKPVSALRVHQLVENGTLDLDSNVNDFLRSWQVPENEFTSEEKVTLRRILNHTAGLTVHGFPGYDKGDAIPSVVAVLDGEGNTDPVRVFRKPGVAWKYSGGGYTVMQLVITDVEQAAFPEIMRKHVLEPLGMTESTFGNPLPERFHARAATGYRANGDEVEGKWPIYPEMAAAGLWTTPQQLVQYAIAIQTIDQQHQDGILKSSTVAEMLKPGLNEFGLGPSSGEHTFGHGGADEGFRAQLVAWKDRANAVVVMVNSDNGTIIQEVIRAIADEYELPGMAGERKSVHELSRDELAKFEGTYLLPGMATMVVSAEDQGLRVQSSRLGVLELLPESETLFFERSTGTAVDFRIDDGVVTGFTFGPNLETKKISQ